MKKDKTIIFGRQPILEALQSGTTIDKIFVKRGSQSEIISRISSLARKQNIPVQLVPIEKLNRLSRQNHQGIIAKLSPIQFHNLEDILSNVFESGEMPLFILLDKISDVRNFGAIVRTAHCMGVHGIIIPGKGSAAINEEAIKTSAGALLKMPVCRFSSILTAVHYLKENGLLITAADLSGEQFIGDMDLNLPLAVVLGSEGFGINEDLLEQVDQVFKIPQKTEFDSLNVSVASGMILYEILRQQS